MTKEKILGYNGKHSLEGYIIIRKTVKRKGIQYYDTFGTLGNYEKYTRVSGYIYIYPTMICATSDLKLLEEAHWKNLEIRKVVVKTMGN